MATVRVTDESLAAAIASIDWAKLEALTDEEIAAAVASDPDAAPIFSAERLFAARVRFIRKRTGLGEAAFAARYGLPVEAVRDWEAGTAMPDAAGRAYLRAIGNRPDAVAEAYAA